MGLTSLSWLVLAGSVCHSIGIAFILMAVIAFIIGGLFVINFFDTYDDDADAEKQKFSLRAGIIAWIFSLIVATIGALMPSEKAVYMVAGIELVNKFSKTETAKELGDSGMSIVKDITTIIHNYTIDDNGRR